MSEFASAVAPLGEDAALVELVGEIGQLDAADVAHELAEVGRQSYRRLVVDTTRADIQVADVVSAIYDLARSVRARDGLVAVVAPRAGELAQIIRATGLQAALSLYETRNDALDDLGLPDPA